MGERATRLSAKELSYAVIRPHLSAAASTPAHTWIFQARDFVEVIFISPTVSVYSYLAVNGTLIIV